jgi:protein-L-isoaspartate(D-aspartate) O-methyltransferase
LNKRQDHSRSRDGGRETLLVTVDVSSNVKVVVGDGTLGWQEYAPYDGIIVTAAAPHLPRPLEEQLSRKNGSRIVIPIGDAQDQDLIAYERWENGLREINLGGVRFVPLIGAEGWQEPESG